MRVDANGAVAPEALIDLGRTEATSGIPESVSADGRLLTLRVSRSGQLPDVMLFHLDGTEKTLVSSGLPGILRGRDRAAKCSFLDR